MEVEVMFFKFLIAVLAVTGIFEGCVSGSSPTSSEAESILFEKLDLPSYEYINGEVSLYRMVLKAKVKNMAIESFVWEIILQQLTLEKFKLFAYKDANFTIPAFSVNPIAVVGDRKIPDGRPDYYYQQYPIYLAALPIDLAGAKEVALPVDVSIYFDFRGLMAVIGPQPGLSIYLEGAYLAGKTAAKKPIVSE